MLSSTILMCSTRIFDDAKFICKRRQEGAVLLDNLEIANISTILNFATSGEATALLAEFKISLNAYLKELVSSQVRTLADIIAFNQQFADLVSVQNENRFLSYVQVAMIYVQ